MILVKSQRAGERVMRSVTQPCQKQGRADERMQLPRLHDGVAKKIRWTDKALAQFKRRVKELTSRSWEVSIEYRLHKLGQYVRG